MHQPISHILHGAASGIRPLPADGACQRQQTIMIAPYASRRISAPRVAQRRPCRGVPSGLRVAHAASLRPPFIPRAR
eukprot:1291421-Pyramimonas_sp.AAC.1